MTTWRVKPIPKNQQRDQFDKWQLLKSGTRIKRFANKRSAKSVMRGKARKGDTMIVEKLRGRGTERMTKQ